jgi:hypothetical protein
VNGRVRARGAVECAGDGEGGCGDEARGKKHETEVLLLFNTTRTTSGPPSTRASIAMDGGVADTTC